MELIFVLDETTISKHAFFTRKSKYI